MRRIGFVGLGVMGGPMAANLLKAGFQVDACDVRRDAVEVLAGQGARAVAGVGELAECEDQQDGRERESDSMHGNSSQRF